MNRITFYRLFLGFIFLALSLTLSAQMYMTNGNFTVAHNSTSFFFDPGGPTARYNDNQSLELTVYPANRGIFNVAVFFNTINTESQNDVLQVFDGSNTSAPRLASLSGNQRNVLVKATNTDGALHFLWRSDASVNADGWEAFFYLLPRITVVPIDPPSQVTANPSSIPPGASSRLNARAGNNMIRWFTNPNGGVALGTSFSGEDFTVQPTGTTTFYAEAYRNTASTASIQALLSRLNNNYESLQSLIPNRYDFQMDATQGVNDSYISDGGGDMFDTGNYLNTNIQNQIRYSDNTITPSPAFGNNGRYFTRCFPGLFIMAAEMNRVSDFRTSGDTGADGSGTADGGSFNTTVNGIAYNCFYKRIYGAGDPSINQLVMVPANQAVLYYYSSDTNSCDFSISNLISSNRLYYILFSTNVSSAGHTVEASVFERLAVRFLSNIGSEEAEGISYSRTPVTVTVTDPPVGTLSAPSPVMANPGIVSPGTSSNLSAISNSNNIRWFLTPTGGQPIAFTSSGESFMVSPWSTTTYYAEAYRGNPSGSALSSVLNSLNSNHTQITRLIPDRHDFSMDGTGGANGNSIDDGGSDMYDTGNILSTNFSNQIQYSDNRIISSGAFGTGGQYFTRHYPGLFVLAADINQVNSFAVRGNLGADGSGSTNAISFQVTVNGTPYSCFLRRIWGAGDPSVNQLIIIPQNSLAQHQYVNHTNDHDQSISSIQSTRRLYYLLFATSAGSSNNFVDNATVERIATAFLNNVGTMEQASFSAARTAVTVVVEN